MTTVDPSQAPGADDRWRCRRSFSQFLWWDPELPTELVEQLWERPDALLSDGQRLQHKPRASVVRLDHPAGPFVWKHHNWGSRYRATKKLLSRSAASKSCRDARWLYAAGVPTPRPRALLERRFGPFHRCSYLLTDFIPSTSLYRLMRFGRPTPDFTRHVARQVAAIWQQLDDLLVWHNDFKTENLLVNTDGKVWLIDFERMRRTRNRSELRRRQLRDLAVFFHPRNWRANPSVADVFRRELMKTPAVRASMIDESGGSHPLAKPAPTSNRASQLVTVVIPTRTTGPSLLTCIESARDFADEIVVAHSGEVDDAWSAFPTTDVCRIVRLRCDDERAFAAWADAQARHPWILRLLPGEQLTSELGQQVQEVLSRDPAENGFRISRWVHFRGRTLKHSSFGHGDSIRLYRKGAARYELCEGQVEVAMDARNVGLLPGLLFYESCVDLETHLFDSIKTSTPCRDWREGARPYREVRPRISPRELAVFSVLRPGRGMA